MRDESHPAESAIVEVGFDSKGVEPVGSIVALVFKVFVPSC